MKIGFYLCAVLGFAGHVNGAAVFPLVNPGFEVDEDTHQNWPSSAGDWSGDDSEIVGTTAGISPHGGQQMLQFIDTVARNAAGVGTGSDVYQLVDLSGLSLDSDSRISLSAWFNTNETITSPSSLQVAYLLQARFYTGAMSDFPTGIGSPIGEDNIMTDAVSNDLWQQVSLSDVEIPDTATYVAVRVAAVRDSGGPFSSTFADDVLLTIDGLAVPPPAGVPEPSRSVVALLGLVSTCLIRRRK